MQTKTLTTQAITYETRNPTRTYEHTVVLEERAYFGQTKMDWVLKITGTPGQWYMTTLEANLERGEEIDISGGWWYCRNFAAILAEAQTLLAGTDRLTVADLNATV